MSDASDSTWATYAALAADVYNTGQGNQELSLRGFTRPASGDRTYTLRDGNFYGQIYVSGSGSLVVSIRGMDSNWGGPGSDASRNLGQVRVQALGVGSRHHEARSNATSRAHVA